MTDLLAERFTALADTTEDGSWLDVRRRAGRRRRRTLTALAATVAVLGAAAAVAATGGWLFDRHGDEVTAVTHVRFHGSSWTVAVSVTSGRAFCARLVRGNGTTPVRGCGAYLIPLPAVVERLHARGEGTFAPPFGALSFREGAGQLWFGTARADVTRIAITDRSGRVHSVATTAAPPSLHTSARFWAIPLPSSKARSIAGYAADGTLVKKAAISGAKGRMRQLP